MGNTGDEPSANGFEKRLTDAQASDDENRRIFRVPDPSHLGMSLARMEEIEKARASGQPIELTPEEQANYDAASHRLKSVLDNVRSPAVASSIKLVEAQMPHIADVLKLSAQVQSRLSDPALTATIESARRALELQAGTQVRPDSAGLISNIDREASQSSISAQQTETLLAILAEHQKTNEAQEKHLAELVKANEQSAQGSEDTARTARTARTIGILGLILASLAIIVSILIPVFQGFAASNPSPAPVKTNAIESPSPSATTPATPTSATRTTPSSSHG